MELVVLDFETTGLSATSGDRIVEVGAARYSEAALVQEFESLVNPLRPISPGASRVNRLTDQMVAGAPTIDRVLPELLEFVGKSTIVAHNAQFDLSFLECALSDLGLAPIMNDTVCTLRLARTVIPWLRSYSLDSLVRSLRLDVDVRHRALADVHATWELLRALLSAAAADRDLTTQDLVLLQHGLVPGLSIQTGRIPGGAPPREWTDPPVDLPEVFRSAIREDRRLRIAYRKASGEISSRTITPLSAYQSGPHIYLVAECHLRGERRTFRLDRVLEVREAS